MASLASVPTPGPSRLQADKIAEFPRTRALAWNGDVLYAAQGYTLLKARMTDHQFRFLPVATHRPQWWRNLSSKSRLGFRLVRDGFHALAADPAGNLIAAVPGAIATLRHGKTEFEVSYRILRGARPLHITVTPGGRAYWGEYFDNARREEVYIYASDDGGSHWEPAHIFPKGTIRHVHNMIYDRWDNCLWILTGDYGTECKILRASLDFATVEEVLAGNQQARTVAVIVDKTGLFYASDTPLEQNHIYHLDRRGTLRECCEISSSSIYGCRTLNGMFFSTMIEPSDFNHSRDVTLFGSPDGELWDALACWQKDRWSMKYFQYGNAFLPDGENATNLLAATTVAVGGADLKMTIWKISSSSTAAGNHWR